jgi:hypothetical protein
MRPARRPVSLRGNQQRQADEIASIQVEVGNLPSGDDFRDRRGLGFNPCRVAPHGYLLVHSPYRQFQVDPQLLTNLQGDARTHQLAESRSLGRDRVISNGQRSRYVLAGLV